MSVVSTKSHREFADDDNMLCYIYGLYSVLRSMVMATAAGATNWCIGIAAVIGLSAPYNIPTTLIYHSFCTETLPFTAVNK